MNGRTWLVALLGTAGLGVIVGCGSDGGPSQLEYIAQADPICARAGDTVDAAFEAFWADAAGIGSGEDEFFVALDDTVRAEVAPAVETMIDELRDLEPPDADRETLGELFDDLETALGEMLAITGAAADGDVPARAALDGSDPFGDVDQRAREYGFGVCGASED